MSSNSVKKITSNDEKHGEVCNIIDKHSYSFHVEKIKDLEVECPFDRSMSVISDKDGIKIKKHCRFNPFK